MITNIKSGRDFNIARNKGDIGEQIIHQYLINKGYNIYKIDNKQDGSHRFDFFADHVTNGCFAADVKTKARFNNWPRQGINTHDWKKYKEFSDKHNMPFYAFFVDDKNGDVHRADLLTIGDEMYVCDGEIITWPIANMDHLFTLTKNQITEISKYDQRNYAHDPK